MPRTAFEVDLSRPPEVAEIKTHNRWHPDIPMVEMFKPGDEFRVECYDWTGGQIENDDSANDVRDVDLTKVHYLSGPFGVEGAEPGDLLVVDLLDLGYLPAPLPGASPGSSPARTAAASSPTTSRRRGRPAGTSTASTPHRGTSRACDGPASSIPA
jgi:hypothetical protein